MVVWLGRLFEPAADREEGSLSGLYGQRAAHSVRMPLRLCAYPRCPALVKSGCCADHGGTQGPRQRFDSWRGSAHSRGYDRHWQAFREGYLRRHPMCVDCSQEFATEVHHKAKLRSNPERKTEEANLMALCKRCHSARNRARRIDMPCPMGWGRGH